LPGGSAGVEGPGADPSYRPFPRSSARLVSGLFLLPSPSLLGDSKHLLARRCAKIGSCFYPGGGGEPFPAPSKDFRLEKDPNFFLPAHGPTQRGRPRGRVTDFEQKLGPETPVPGGGGVERSHSPLRRPRVPRGSVGVEGLRGSGRCGRKIHRMPGKRQQWQCLRWCIKRGFKTELFIVVL